MSKRWQPTASLEMLEQRALLLQQVRAFFYARKVLEVETPVLGSSITCDPALNPFVIKNDERSQVLLLQSSPEFAMKRLLASYSKPIYQIGKAFRNGESGKRHNPEFTMLEWYRPDFSMQQLMGEVWELVSDQLGMSNVLTKPYKELFQQYLGIDISSSSVSELHALAKEKTGYASNEIERDTLLNLLYSECIEPHLIDPVFIINYPASQAALAQIQEDEDGLLIAKRFELVIKGIEIANGYLELTDSVEQKERFKQETSIREKANLPLYPTDEKLLQALEAGMPDCSGVALGLDRLLMLKTNATTIQEVLAFPIEDI